VQHLHVHVYVQHPHLDHDDSAADIARLTLAARCKRKATEDEAPLRQLFDEVCRQASLAAAQSLSFAEVENAMYKRRRLNQPP